MYTKALLSRKQLNICLPMGSSEWIPYFALLAYTALLHLFNCLYHDPQVFLAFTLPILSPILLGVNELATGWKFTCQLGSPLYSFHFDFFKKKTYSTGDTSVGICFRQLFFPFIN